MSVLDFLRVSVTAGIKPVDFWQMTPAEIFYCADFAVRRKEAETKEKIMVAYITASLARVAKMPSLQTVLGWLDSEKATKKMTPEQMLAQVKRLNQIFGGESVSENGGS